MSSTEVVGLSLALLNLAVWGSWPSIRMLCQAEGVLFAPLYFAGQLSSALLWSFVLDTSPKRLVSSFFEPVYFHLPLFLILGGVCIGNADFLCSIAMSHIPFSIAFPIYAGLTMALGTTLVFLISSVETRGDPLLLFLGVFFAIVAILCLARADQQHEQTAKATATATTDTTSLTKTRGEEEKGGGVVKSAVNSWVLVCVACGLIGCLWSPLCVLGRSEQGGVTDPFAALVLFEIGQFFSVPMELCYYAHFISKHDNNDVSSPVVYLHQLLKLPIKDKAFGFLAGCFVGTGYSLFFFTSSLINPTIALAIPSCEPLMTILLGVLQGDLHSASFSKRAYYLASCVFFVLAISFIATSGGGA